MKINKSTLFKKYGVTLPGGKYKVYTKDATYDIYTVQDDTIGCPLLGLTRTPTGIRNCTPPNTRLLEMLEAEGIAGREVWLEVL